MSLISTSVENTFVIKTKSNKIWVIILICWWHLLRYPCSAAALFDISVHYCFRDFSLLIFIFASMSKAQNCISSCCSRVTALKIFRRHHCGYITGSGWYELCVAGLWDSGQQDGGPEHGLCWRLWVRITSGHRKLMGLALPLPPTGRLPRPVPILGSHRLLRPHSPQDPNGICPDSFIGK